MLPLDFLYLYFVRRMECVMTITYQRLLYYGINRIISPLVAAHQSPNPGGCAARLSATCISRPRHVLCRDALPCVSIFDRDGISAQVIHQPLGLAPGPTTCQANAGFIRLSIDYLSNVAWVEISLIIRHYFAIFLKQTYRFCRLTLESISWKCFH